MRAEILLSEADTAARGVAILEAMRDTAPIPCVVTTQGYRGKSDILITYGTGHPIRRNYWMQHRRRGLPCIGWDLGYWDHATGTMRATLNDDHPAAYIRAESPDRFDASGIELRDDYNPDGPIVLVGMGRKAAVLHAGAALVWERRTLAAIRAAYPKREIVFRPKRITGPLIRGLRVAKDGPIAEAIAGASLVVCRHSNVAIDACIAGVPVVCEDGAASALYGRDLRKPLRPGFEQRRELLRSVAWWNWKPSEAGEAWTYLLSRL